MGQIRLRTIDDGLHDKLKHIAIEKKVTLEKLITDILQKAISKIKE